MSVLYLIGFIQSVFISSLILLKKRKQASDYILALYILVLGFLLFFIFARQSGIYQRHSLVIILDILYWVWVGPLLYIYIELVTGRTDRLRATHLVHLLPTAVVLAGFSGYFLDPGVEFFEDYSSDSIFFKAANLVWYYNSPVYYIICIILLVKHKRAARNYFSYTGKTDLRWLFYLANGFAAYLIFGILLGLVVKITGVELPFGSSHYTWLVMVIYIFGMGYWGYFQRGIFFSGMTHDARQEGAEERGGRYSGKVPQYERSGLSSEESDEILSRLLSTMKEKKPYMNFELNLKELAEMVKTTPHKLSQVINEKLKCNFFEFVNSYRVDEVKRSLADPSTRDLKIISIAYDCGFSSKSVFYNAFRNKTSMTPVEFRKQIMDQLVDN